MYNHEAGVTGPRYKIIILAVSTMIVETKAILVSKDLFDLVSVISLKLAYDIEAGRLGRDEKIIHFLHVTGCESSLLGNYGGVWSTVDDW
jgi:hypothetical protein